MVITASKIKGCAIDDEDDAEDHPITLDDEDDLYDEREMSPRTNIDLSCETNGYGTFEQGTNKYYVTSQFNLQCFIIMYFCCSKTFRNICLFVKPISRRIN